MAEDYKPDNSLLSIEDATKENERLKADYLKQKEQKGVSSPQTSCDSDSNNLEPPGSLKTFPPSGTNKSLPDEHEERPSETKIENTKVKFNVDQTKETSKRPPEKLLEQPLLHKKLQEQARQEQLRTNLHRVSDKIMVVNNIESARQVVQKLTTDYKNFVHACDTEASQHSISMYFIMSNAGT